MAQRQSLKDLQERLALRLSATKTDVATASWLAVEAREQRYLLPLVQAGEIFSWAPVQAVPYTRSWYLGVASLRGGVYGVVDLSTLPGISASTASVASSRVTTESRLISLHPALDMNVVLWVDRLLGLRDPSMFSALQKPAVDAPNFCIRVLVDEEGGLWQELDLQILAEDPQFLNIIA